MFGVNNHLASELHLIVPMTTPSQSSIFANGDHARMY